MIMTELKTIKIYYNPKTQKYARTTKANENRGAYDELFKWKPKEKLYRRHQEKIELLSFLEVPDHNALTAKIPGIGGVRRSKMHRELIIYFLFNDTWKKELPNDEY